MRTRPRAGWLVAVLVLTLLATTAPAGAATGQWERAWGLDVVSGGGTDLETCLVANQCKAGVFGGVGGNVGNAQGLAVDPVTGAVWVSETGSYRVSKFTADGAFVLAVGKDVGGPGVDVCTVASQCTTGTAGAEGGEFDNVFGLGSDAAGNVYVADAFNQRVQQLTPAGAFVRAWGIGVAGGSGFQVCTAAASCTVGSSSGTGGGYFGPSSVAVDGSVVYVSDQGGNRVSAFATSATPSDVTFLRAWGKDVVAGNAITGAEVCTVAAECKAGGSGALGGELSSATGVAVRDGHVYVVESGNDRIQVFSTAGAFERTWGKDVTDNGAGSTGFEVCTTAATCKAGVAGTAAGELAIQFNPRDGVAVGAASDVYVSDTGNDRVQVFAPDGTFRRSFGSTGTQGGQLDGPLGIDAGAAHQVFVVDALNSRVQKFRDSSAGPATFALSSATYSHGEQAGVATITVIRGGDLVAPVGVAYATSDGSASAGSDYVSASGTLAFAPGQTSRTFQVQVTDDQATEPDETVILTLSDPSYGDQLVAPSTATLTIVDDDTLNTQFLSGPTSGVTRETQPTYTFSSTPPGALFQCSVDSIAEASFQYCSSGWQVPAPLADGGHHIYVRAVIGNPATQVDPSPATASITVDTTGPTTNLTVAPKPGAGSQISPGVFTGTVRVTATQTDPPPASLPGTETRCAFDIPAPATFSLMPATLCPTEISAPGTHTVYAASRDLAGNPGPVVSSSFTIRLVPDTTITSGPAGETYLKTPYFGFTSTVAGSRFECRLGGAAFAACTNPYLSAPLTPGSYSFQVRAVSPDGTPDPTPAQRLFSVGRLKTVSSACTIKPFLDTDFDIIDGAPPMECSMGAHVSGHEACGGDYVCVSKDLDCPVFSSCTLTTTTDWQDRDDGAEWFVGARADILPTGTSSAGCDTGPHGDRCTATDTATAIVVPLPNYGGAEGWGFASCYAFRGVRTGGTLGPASARSLKCRASVTYRPIEALSAVASGSSFQLLVPGAGTVIVGPGNTPGRLLGRGPAKPPFSTTVKTVKADGVMSVKPKLTKKLKKKLKRGKKVRLTVKVTYRSTAGTVATEVSRVVLQKPRKVKGPQPPSAIPDVG